MGKKLIMLVLTLFTFVTLVSAGNQMIMKVNILQPVIEVSVPSELHFGDIMPGQESEDVAFVVNNTGTVDVNVQVQLSDYFGSVFNNLKLKERYGLESSYMSFSTHINATSYNEIYAKLDLRDFESTQEMLNHEARVVFVAMPA